MTGSVLIDETVPRWVASEVVAVKVYPLEILEAVEFDDVA